MKNKGLYSEANKAEEKRLAKKSNKNQFVFDVSWKLIAQFLKKGRVLLDMGAGSNPNIGFACIEREVKYVAIDKNESMVQKLENVFEEHKVDRNMFSIKQDDALSHKGIENDFLVGHMRFVLMHNSTDKKLLINNLVSCSKHAIFVEWDWNTFKGKGSIFNEVKDFLIETSSKLNIDVFAGATLSKDVESIFSKKKFPNLTISCKRRRSRGDETELIDLLKTVQEVCEKIGMSTEKTVAGHLINELSGTKMTFRRPDIVSVVVSKK